MKDPWNKVPFEGGAPDHNIGLPWKSGVDLLYRAVFDALEAEAEDSSPSKTTLSAGPLRIAP